MTDKTLSSLHCKINVSGVILVVVACILQKLIENEMKV